MKKGFTIVEISILAVILIIVGCLIIPFSIDDTLQASHVIEWRALQDRINHAFAASVVYGTKNDKEFEEYMMKSISDSKYKPISPYKIKYMNGKTAVGIGDFTRVYEIGTDNVIGFRWDVGKNGQVGTMFYDINGKKGPNRWGKDVFGVKIYPDKIEPLCAQKSHQEIVADCSKGGTGCCCSYYYLIGGTF